MPKKCEENCKSENPKHKIIHIWRSKIYGLKHKCIECEYGSYEFGNCSEAKKYSEIEIEKIKMKICEKDEVEKKWGVRYYKIRIRFLEEWKKLTKKEKLKQAYDSCKYGNLNGHVFPESEERNLVKKYIRKLCASEPNKIIYILSKNKFEKAKIYFGETIYKIKNGEIMHSSYDPDDQQHWGNEDWFIPDYRIPYWRWHLDILKKKTLLGQKRYFTNKY